MIFMKRLKPHRSIRYELDKNLGASYILNKKQEAIFKRFKIKKTYLSTHQRKCWKKEIWLDHINGYIDHAHCLLSLGRDQSISKVAQLVKGESSYWINQNNLTTNKFIWQDDYKAVSVSESHLDSTRSYIKN